MSRFNYVCTAQKPTAVTHSCVGNFTSQTDRNLILGKSSRLEIHLMTAEGLEPMLDVPIYGRIGTMQLFRPKARGERQDRLFICTERYKFCVLGFDEKSKEIVTLANGDIKHKVGRVTDLGQIGIVDPQCRAIGLHAYDGIFQAIPLDSKGALHTEAFDMRLPELQVAAMCFLDAQPQPTLALLHQDAKEKRHLKTYVVSFKHKELRDGPFAQSNIDASAGTLIPVAAPFGGVIIIGEETISYHSGKSMKTIKIKPTQITAWGALDAHRFLLGDLAGNLYVLVLTHDNTSVLSLALNTLGVTSSAHTLSYLDNGHVFVGSAHGDSQLIRLSSEPAEGSGSSFVSVVESYSNCGAIVDMAVMDLDRQGQAQLVTASGAYKDGSLRVIRNGIGINEEAAIELPGMKGLWSLREDSKESKGSGGSFDKYLVQSFVSETRVLAIDEEQLSETAIAGFDAKAATLFCCNCWSSGAGALLLQVTAGGARLVSASSLQLVSQWTPPAGVQVTVAHANASQVLLATAGARLVLLRVTPAGALKEEAHAALDHEVSCINISPVGGEAESKFAAVGMWKELSVRMLALPSLKELTRDALGGEIVPRSLLMTRFEPAASATASASASASSAAASSGGVTLLCGLGDGTLVTYSWDAAAATLGNKKKIALGTQPISLTPFQTKDRWHVFASCDRPTVIYSTHGKLVYSNVNLKDVNYMAPFHTSLFLDCMALATEETLLIGRMDAIQKLHVKTVPLGEQPRRLAHQPSSKTIAVCTIRFGAGSSGSGAADSSGDSKGQVAAAAAAAAAAGGGEVNFIRLVDEQTFEQLSSIQLDPFENGSAIASVKFSGDSSDYYVVGTAYARPAEEEPKEGRILVLRVHERRLQLVAKTPTKGAVYTLAAFQGKLIAGINSKVQLYKWVPGSGSSAGSGSGSGSAASGKEGKESKGDGKEAKSESKGVAPMVLSGVGGGQQSKLVPECSHHGSIIVLSLKTRGDFIIVGDLMKSVSLLTYRAQTSTIEELARDFDTNWMTACEMLADDIFLGAENCFNLFTLYRNVEALAEEDRARLEVCGRFHTGEFINCIRPGSLVMNLPDADADNAARIVPSHVFGSINGVVGVVAPLTRQQFAWFSRLEEALESVIRGVGGFSHKEWRAFSNERRTEPRSGFVDGDLIESLLELPQAKIEQIAKLIDTSPQELVKRVEDAARIH